MKNNFFNLYLNDSIKLKDRFAVTTENRWMPMAVLAELYVQLGHVCSILKESKYKEDKREINDLGDEISDVIFQLIIIGDMYNFNFDKYKHSQDNKATIEDLVISLGQLSESVMEECGYRFKKSRFGFMSTLDFIYFKIENCLDIIFSMGNYLRLNIEYEYKKMLDDANNWLDKNYKQV